MGKGRGTGSSDDAATSPAASSVAGVERALWVALLALACAVAFGLGRKAAPAGVLGSGCVAEADTDFSLDGLAAPPDGDAASRVSPGDSNSGHMMMKWQTPIFTVNLGSVYPKARSLNANLTTAILKQYAKFADDPRLSGTGWQPNGANQRFFEWQTAGGWNATVGATPEAKVVTDFMQLAVDNYMLGFGLPLATVRGRDRTPHQWATVHRAGMHHMRHSHPDNVVSGVYYVSVPDDAGPIVLEDPRGGGRPPFDDRFTFVPKEGDLVLFPSWLMHEVRALCGHGGAALECCPACS